MKSLRILHGSRGSGDSPDDRLSLGRAGAVPREGGTQGGASRRLVSKCGISANASESCNGHDVCKINKLLL